MPKSLLLGLALLLSLSLTSYSVVAQESVEMSNAEIVETLILISNELGTAYVAFQRVLTELRTVQTELEKASTEVVTLQGELSTLQEAELPLLVGQMGTLKTSFDAYKVKSRRNQLIAYAVGGVAAVAALLLGILK
jgi:hypothetical protein